MAIKKKRRRGSPPTHNEVVGVKKTQGTRLPIRKFPNRFTRIPSSYSLLVPPRLQLAIDICYLMSANEYATREEIASHLNADVKEVRNICMALVRNKIFVNGRGKYRGMVRKCVALNAAALYTIVYTDKFATYRSPINEAVAKRMYWNLRGIVL
jgi:hypothetical protein